MERLFYRSTSVSDLIAELHHRDLVAEARQRALARAARQPRSGLRPQILGLVLRAAGQG
jgi:hypothetical protein